MLEESEIRAVLGAARVVPLTISSPHGPLGLEQLAEEVRRLGTQETTTRSTETVTRPIPLKTETWQKLDQIAHESSVSAPVPASASDVAIAIIEHYVASMPK